MNADPNPAKSIFLQALERHSPDQWPAFLDQACAGQPDLRGHVEALLKAHREVGTAEHQERAEGAGPSPVATVDEPPVREQPGTVIGPYKLLEQIGEGGFGVVFMAEQTRPIRRKVALKILKPGMDTRPVVARFEAERQALALMDHLNIARVFDGGATPSGRPYFVMELVKGVPITDFCDQNHLTPRQRLELFLSVCQAVQHAHQKGIIHRDLKPSNVLVTVHDTTPVVKVIDFGVAKALGQELTDKTLFTGFAQMIGTPLYMSPEQAGQSGLDIDTRSDIYSLGVLLYELLTGTTPFTRERLKQASYDEIRRIIREEEPPRPSTRLAQSKDTLATISAQRQTEPAKLTKLLRGELDWIVMKALEKDRNRRYDTANAFAMDVQRYLADEPVLACPPSTGYRLRKFVRRNKWGLTTAVLVCAALVAGTAVSLWQAVRAVQAEGRTQVELELKKQQHARAEANFRRTLAAVDGLLLEVGEKDLRAEPHLEHVRRRLLEKALHFFEEFLQEKGDDPSTRFEAALACHRVGDIRHILGPHQQADEDYLRGIGLLEQLAADFPAEAAYRRELALTLDDRAVLLLHLGQHKEASGINQRAVELQEELSAADPDDAGTRIALAKSLSLHAELLNGQRRSEEAIQACRRALDLLNAAEKSRHSVDRVIAQETLAVVLDGAGRMDDAEEAYRQTVAMAEDLVQRLGDGPDGPRAYDWLSRMDRRLSEFLWRRGRIPAAEEAARQAVDSAKQLAAKYPNVPAYQSDLSGAYGNQGTLYWKTGRPRDAIPFLEEARKIREKLAANYAVVPDYQSNLGAALGNLAGAYIAAGDQEKARPLLEEAIKHLEAALKIARHRRYREGLCKFTHNLAGVLSDLAVPEAEQDRAYQRSIGLIRELARDFPDVAEYQSQVGACLRDRAVLLWKRGQLGQARQLVEEAIPHQRAALKGNERNPTYLDFLNKHYATLAQILRDQESPDLERVYRDRLPVLQRLAELFPKDPEHPSYLGVLKNDLATMVKDRGEWQEARRLLEEAIVHQQAAVALQPSEPRFRYYLGNHYQNLGTILTLLGRDAEGLKAYRECIDIRKKLAGDFPKHRPFQVPLGEVLLQMAHVSGDTNALKEAANAFRRAGGWKSAAEAFRTAMPLSDKSEGYVLLLGAMLAWHLDFKDEAAAWYRKAVDWEEKNATTLSAAHAQRLRKIRVEAEALLGIKKK
jgi:serine/threonine protein kinase/tetratricopeptide (TPR) repeat protein